jgi:hypothetical protein
VPSKIAVEVDVTGALARFGTVAELMEAVREAGTGNIITRHAVMKWKARNSMPLRAFAALAVTAKKVGVTRVNLTDHTTTKPAA